MVKKLRPLLVKKYDISHKIFNELINLESRHILFSIIKKPKRIQEIAKELKIPLSSAYKRIQSLKDCSLILEKPDFAENGHIVTFYQSMIKDITITIKEFEPSISFTKNPNLKNE
ncbi:winged helix-turn-helix domain-containing protein [Nitrosopumilus piranensis]|uniref:winged helix-turn-helix domain-containing protein n=1 Tax=Nitrosopumilus piranensis TaxID=1582439 RepID=UPI0011E59651|nr:winged helix-turn-helix domain-containing protein [Nitrosopumilus piranensis]